MTVAVIRQAALESQQHYEVRALAEQICRDLRPRDYISEAIAIGNFVWTNTRYMRDPRTIELVKAPYLVARQLGAGQKPQLDCDDLTAFICALLLAVGCECRAVTVAFKDMYYKGQRQYSHVFAQAKDPKSGAWITLDPVAGRQTDKMLKTAVAAKTWPIA